MRGSAARLVVTASLLAACACGRSLPVSVDDPPVEAGVLTCAWDATFDPPVPLAGAVNAVDVLDDSPTLSADERRIVFQRGKGLLFIAERADPAAPFGNVRPLTYASGPQPSDVGRYHPSLSLDGTTLAYAEVRDDVWTIWVAPVNLETATVGSPTNALAAAGTVYFTPHILDAKSLWFTRRDTVDAGVTDAGPTYAPVDSAWSAELLSDGGAAVAREADDALHPLLTDQGKTLYIRRKGTVYRSHRATLDVKFASFAPVPELAIDGARTHATWLSPDGCRLYLASSRGVPGDLEAAFDLYVARRR